MKSFDSRTYSISDFVEWNKQKQLILNPAFQRRAVWSDKAKSYLMDTIIRGKPMPKVFVRQKINVTTQTSVREIVDGQQRLRTILSFINDGFALTKNQHPDFGGARFSQLPEEVQSQVLNYEVAVDLLINLPDTEILDIFARLNSYAVILNEQEKINASHFGPFKVLADTIGFKYNEYWKAQGILTEKQILRMAEISLVADLLISLREGIRSKKRVKVYYAQYEKLEDDDVDGLAAKFDAVTTAIGKIYPEGLAGTEFHRIHLFYSLFTAVAHALHGIKNFTAADGSPVSRPDLTNDTAFEVARNGLDHVGEIFAVSDVGDLAEPDREFVQDSRRATTDEVVRERRTRYLLGLMV